MAMTEYITDEGKEMLAQMLAGHIKITFTKIQMGDGTLRTGQSKRMMTELVHLIKEIEVYRTRMLDENVVSIMGIFSNTGMESGFYFREKGIFASDGANEILFAYANAGESAEYINPPTVELIEKQIISLYTNLQNTETEVNITVASGIYALYEDIEEMQKKLSEAAFTGSYNDLSDKPTIPAEVKVKGNEETDFHTGNVNLTPANIGSPSNEYIEEHFAPDYASSSLFYTGSEGVGWYRIAKAKYPYYNSCTITLKRSYNSPGPEYQKIQLMDAYDKHKFISLAAYSHSHLWTKIRETWDSDKSEAYIEIYLNYVTNANGAYKSNNWRISIEDALSAATDGAWKTLTPEKTEETVDGIEILASMDLPANFDPTYLAKKDGSNASGTWGINISGNAASATKSAQDGDGNVIKDSYAVRKVVTGGDFNDMTTPGLYTMKNASANKPSSGSYYGLLVLKSDNGNYVEQIAFMESSHNIYIRYFSNTSWGAWKEILTEESYINLTDNASGILPVNHGGTGNSNGKLPYNKVLWSGTLFMQEGQSATLSESAKSQPHGIVLEFSEYATITGGGTFIGTAQTFFVPIASLINGTQHAFSMATYNFSKVCFKELNIQDGIIYGTSGNNLTGTAASGIKYDNKAFVLSRVYGV